MSVIVELEQKQEVTPHELETHPPTRDRWRLAVVQRIVDALVGTTKSAFVVFRTPEVPTEMLVLEAYAPTAQEQQNPPLTEQFQIPQRKHISCWGMQDLTQVWSMAWGIRSYSNGAARPEYGESPAERAFAQWIMETAWFPIMLGEATFGVVILVRGSREPYEFTSVADSWLLAQECISHSLSSPAHKGFLEALDALNGVVAASNYVTLLQGVCHCLASKLGLGWNRVWMFEEDSATSGAFRCLSCLGEVNKERWASVLFTFKTLDEEINTLLRQEDHNQDALFRSCVTNGICELLLSPDNIEAEFSWLLDGNSDKRFPFIRDLSSHLPGVATSFSRLLKERVHDYQSEPEIYYLPLFIAGKRYLVLMSLPYTNQDSAQAPILTTNFLHQAALAVTEWKRTETANQRTDGKIPQ